MNKETIFCWIGRRKSYNGVTGIIRFLCKNIHFGGNKNAWFFWAHRGGGEEQGNEAGGWSGWDRVRQPVEGCAGKLTRKFRHNFRWYYIVCISAQASKPANWNLVSSKAPLCKGGCQRSWLGDWQPLRQKSIDFCHLIHFGMIATGNHGDFDSLRGAQPLTQGRLWAPPQIPIFQLTNPWGYAPSNSRFDKKRELEKTFPAPDFWF